MSSLRFVPRKPTVLTINQTQRLAKTEDYTFSASSRTTYMASLLGFSAVISDAAMIDRVIGLDVQEAAAARDRAPRRGRGMVGPPGQREVEGIGGRLWYELGV